ncbi:MAG TPA: hypothetical protein VFS43_47780 [Polyangiaceae bacterium]|nr:hypothetical protein [Polyangiaceae bacterium]
MSNQTPADETHPFPPGASPFRAKGSFYLGSQEFAEERITGGWAAIVEQCRHTPALARFLGQRFLAASWYDALPLSELARAGARAASLPYATFTRQRAEWQAERDVSGLYRVLLRLTSPDVVIDRLARMVAQRFDFGSSRVEVVGDKRLRFVRAGVPRPLAPWQVSMSEPYTTHLMRMAGARDPSFLASPSFEVDGMAHSVPTVSIVFEGSWR